MKKDCLLCVLLSLQQAEVLHLNFGSRVGQKEEKRKLLKKVKELESLIQCTHIHTQITHWSRHRTIPLSHILLYPVSRRDFSEILFWLKKKPKQHKFSSIFSSEHIQLTKIFFFFFLGKVTLTMIILRLPVKRGEDTWYNRTFLKIA